MHWRAATKTLDLEECIVYIYLLNSRYSRGIKIKYYYYYPLCLRIYKNLSQRAPVPNFKVGLDDPECS